MKKNDKTVEEILKQQYISAYDLQEIIPHLSYQNALKYIDVFRKKMKEKNFFVPDGKTKVALTKIVKKELGVWKGYFMKEILTNKGIIAFFIFVIIIALLNPTEEDIQKKVSAENTNSQIITQK